MNRHGALLFCLMLAALPCAIASSVTVLDWDDLLPEGTDAFIPPVLHGWGGPIDLGFDGFEDDLTNPLDGFDDIFTGFGDEATDPFSAGFMGFRYPPEASVVVPELDGKQVRIPGFIVPLDMDDVGNITEFFLVPYFGACIHVPPPPPNQLVYVTPEEAFPLHSIWDPFWIEGTLRTEQHGNVLGLAGYTMTASKIEIYEY
jgi:uncharacterized protein